MDNKTHLNQTRNIEDNAGAGESGRVERFRSLGLFSLVRGQESTAAKGHGTYLHSTIAKATAGVVNQETGGAPPKTFGEKRPKKTNTLTELREASRGEGGLLHSCDRLNTTPEDI